VRRPETGNRAELVSSDRRLGHYGRNWSFALDPTALPNSTNTLSQPRRHIVPSPIDVAPQLLATLRPCRVSRKRIGPTLIETVDPQPPSQGGGNCLVTELVAV
jgi:hypothetical protein